MKVKELKWMPTESILGNSLEVVGYVEDTITYEVYCSAGIRSYPIYFAFAVPIFGGGTERDRVYDKSGGEWKQLEDCQNACQEHFNKLVSDAYDKVKQFVEE